MRVCKVVLSLIVGLVSIPFAHPANILFLLPLSCISELNALQELANALLSKGHHVTWVTSYKTSFAHSNFSEIVPLPQPTQVYDFQGPAESTIVEYRSRYNQLLPFYLGWNTESLKNRCHVIYNHTGFREEVLSSNSGPFDLVVINGNLHHCLLGVIANLDPKYSPPLIVFTSIPFTGEEFRFPGFRMPSSFVPSSYLGLTGRMTFSQRLLNFVLRMALSSDYVESEGEAVYKGYLQDSQKSGFPPVSQIVENVALVLSNSHPALTSPRPLTPDVVEVGCLQCRKKGPRTPLPSNLEKLMQDAGGDGVILFSMGSMFSFASFPPHLQNIVLNVFSRLNQSVIFVATPDAVAGLTLPKNVLVTPWVPQQDILSDKRLKLFISHGGTQSHLEAAWHGVPVVVLPVWADQALSAAHVTEIGNGISLEILELTEEKFESAINMVLTNPKYTKKAKELSTIFRDQPESSLQRAVFWTEYVIRHKGAKHLRTAARHLNIFQYHNIDIILFIIGSLVLLTWFTLYLCWFIKPLLSKVYLSQLALYVAVVSTLYRFVHIYFNN